MKKFILAAIAFIMFFGGYNLFAEAQYEHPSERPANANVRIDVKWFDFDDDRASWHLRNGRSTPEGEPDWYNYKCEGSGTECDEGDWLTWWMPSIQDPNWEPPLPPEEGTWQSLYFGNYYPANYDAATDLYY